MPTASKQLAREVMDTVLDDGERNLLRVAAQSMSRASGLYGKKYGGHEAVVAEVERIKAKVSRAIGQRVEQVERVRSGKPVEESALEAAGTAPRMSLAPRPSAEPDDLADADEIVGAGAAGPLSGPPPAAPVSDRPRRSLPTNTVTFDRPPMAPSSGADVQGAVLRLLGEQWMTPKRLAWETDTAFNVMKTRMIRMEAQGLVVRTEENAYDWPGANVGRGRPGRVWRLAGSESGIPALNPARRTPVAPRGAPRVPVEPKLTAPALSATGLCRHDVPRGLCSVCGVVPVPIAKTHEAELPVETFDAGKLWESLTVEQRDRLVVVAIRRLTYDDLVRAFATEAAREERV